MRKLFFLMVAVMLTLSLSAKKNKSNDLSKVAAVYMYGLSSSFNDSTVYLTDIQIVDSAYQTGKHFLGGLREYRGQMDNYFTAKMGERRTNTVFFKWDRKKAEKAYLKLRKRYNKAKIELKPLPEGEMKFKATIIPSDEKFEQDAEKSKKTKDKRPPMDGQKGGRPPMGGAPGGMNGGPGGMNGGPGGVRP